MEVQFKKHVKVICDIEAGMNCFVIGYGRPIPDDVMLTVTHVDYRPSCESGFMITVTDYKNINTTLDSGWITLAAIQRATL